MKKLLALSLLAFVIVGCSDGETAPTPDTDSTAASADTTREVAPTDAGTMEDTASNALTFEYFEDYINIANKTMAYELFPAENLQDDTSWYAEGTVMMLSTRLNNPTNGHVIQLVWSEADNESLSHIEALYNPYWRNGQSETQSVKARNGLYTGMRLADIVEWNGADVKFSGFGWDYGGGVFAEPNTKIMDSKVSFTLDMDNDVSYEESEGFFGDIELSTTDEKVKTAPIVITYMNMYVPNTGE